MLTKQEILDFINQNIKVLKNDFHITKIGLFGSFARDDQTSESDIDLIVDFEPGTEDLFELKIKLEEMFKNKFHRPIEICREKYLKSYVKEDICRETVYAG